MMLLSFLIHISVVQWLTASNTATQRNGQTDGLIGNTYPLRNKSNTVRQTNRLTDKQLDKQAETFIHSQSNTDATKKRQTTHILKKKVVVRQTNNLTDLQVDKQAEASVYSRSNMGREKDKETDTDNTHNFKT